MRRSPKKLTNWGVLNIIPDPPYVRNNGTKRFVSRSSIHLDVSGAENLKGFDHLVMENDLSEVEDHRIFRDLLSKSYSNLPWNLTMEWGSSTSERSFSITKWSNPSGHV